MAALKKLCLFTHTKSFIMLLFAIFFTFIFPFEAQQCCAWIVLRISSMSYFILLRLLDVCKWIFGFSIVFGDWHMLCQRLRNCTPNIYSQRRRVYYFYHVHFSCCLFGFVLFCYLSLFFCSLLVHFSLVVQVFDFFVFVNIFL